MLVQGSAGRGQSISQASATSWQGCADNAALPARLGLAASLPEWRQSDSFRLRQPPQLETGTSPRWRPDHRSKAALASFRPDSC
jgi:hypothetical protein